MTAEQAEHFSEEVSESTTNKSAVER